MFRGDNPRYIFTSTAAAQALRADAGAVGVTVPRVKKEHRVVALRGEAGTPMPRCEDRELVARRGVSAGRAMPSHWEISSA